MKIILGVLGLLVCVSAHALEPLHVSEALMGYVTDVYLSERIPDYENPMVKHHRVANENTKKVSAIFRLEQSKGKSVDSALDASSAASRRFDLEMAQALDDSLSNVYWPAQRVLRARMERAIGREVVIGGETTLHSAYFFDRDPELERIVETAYSRLTHDIYQALGSNRKYLGSADYTEGWRAEIELYRKPCLAMLE